jgi:hypothetical protein
MKYNALQSVGIVLTGLAIAYFGIPGIADATSTFITQQGGTGTSSPSGILYGDNGATSHLNTVTIGSGITFSGGTLSASGGSGIGTVATSSLETQGQLGAWGTTHGYPAKLYSVATSSLTVNTPLTTSGTPGALVGGSALTLGCTTASAGVTGCLSGTDWSTFNSKQSALTFSTGLTNTSGTVTVNTSQNISTLSNLTTNGFVKTSGGTGALSIDTSTYLTAAITALGPLNQTQSGATQTLASSTDSTTGLTSGITITASGNTQTFKPTLSGTLATTNGGTGATSISTGLTNSGSIFAQIEHPSFGYATSSWSGTTTLPLGVGYGQTWNSIRCWTDAGSVFVDLYHGSSHTNLLSASTTIGVFTLSTNTSVTTGDKMQVDIGTPASSPTKVSCTVADTL